MIEIYPNLWIGGEQDFESSVKNISGWNVVHACKDPYHRRELGYTTRSAPKEHPEYLIARRDHRLILNLVDSPNPAHIPKEIIDAAIQYIHASLNAGMKVLVHCNQGESRAPSIGFLYLAQYTDILPKELIKAEKAFRLLYPSYKPGDGMTGFLIRHWGRYVKSH
jgi:hypothetical protein